MESNSDCEKALQKTENEYPYSQKVTLENTYGMHFYSKLSIKTAKTHFFVADDIPSVEAVLTTEDDLCIRFNGKYCKPLSAGRFANKKDDGVFDISPKVEFDGKSFQTPKMNNICPNTTFAPDPYLSV